MTVLFDADTGRLRLDGESFEALRAWLRDEAPDADRVAELLAAGVVVDGKPHPALEPAFAAVADPVANLWIRLNDGEREELGEGYVSAEAAAILLDLPDGLRELVTVHPTYLPAALARITQLGPRQRFDGVPVQVTESEFDQLMSPSAEEREAAAASIAGKAGDAETAASAAAVATELWRTWSVQCTWTGLFDVPNERTVQIVDKESGLWWVAREEGGAMLSATTPSIVWLAFVLLLPRTDEVGWKDLGDLAP